MVDKRAVCYHSEPLKRLFNGPLRGGEHHCKPDSKKPPYFLYPHITALLVLAYLNREVDTSSYDSTTYPPLENVPSRYAVVKRNGWMVWESDVVISGILHGL